MGKWSLGEDKITERKRIAYLIYIAGMAVLLYMLVNTNETKYAIIYLMSIAMFFIGDIYDMFSGKKTSISTVSEEPAKLRPFGLDTITDKQLFVLTILGSIAIIFSSLSNKMSIIGTPTFATTQSISQSLLASSLQTAFVALPETLFFFSLSFATIYAFINSKIKEPLFSFAIAGFITSLFFSVFHSSIYGLGNLAASISCFIFGYINCLWIFLFRSSYSLIIYHFILNFMAIFFSMSIIGMMI